MKKIEHAFKMIILCALFVSLSAAVALAKCDLKLEYGSLQCSVVDGNQTIFYKDDVIRVEVKVTNTGADKAPLSHVEFYANDERIGGVTLGPINSGTSKLPATRWMPDGPGTYKIKVVVDPDNDIAEEGEMNNELHKSIRIRDRSKED